MRTIERTTAFKRDYKRETKGQHGKGLDDALRLVLGPLMADQALAPRFRDHALTGEWKGYRDCHVRPDLVLLYRLSGADRLVLVRLGSHSELKL